MNDANILTAAHIVVFYNVATISHLQRHLKLNYSQSSAVMNALEQRGVVSARNSDGKRDILWDISQVASEAVSCLVSACEEKVEHLGLCSTRGYPSWRPSHD